jgi:hypothetical protein
MVPVQGTEASVTSGPFGLNVRGCVPDAPRARSGLDRRHRLRAMAADGRVDCHHDRRYRALVALTTFARLRWGGVAALRRCDLDLQAGTAGVRTRRARP